MATPEAHIREARAFAAALEAHPLIRRAWIDDWGRYSNFALLVVPKRHERSTTTRLKGVLNRACKAQGTFHVREVFPPEPVRRWDAFERRSVIVGYHADFWSVDLDVYAYDPESNAFPTAP